MQLAAGHPSPRGGDHPVGQRHHLRRRPVVPFQAHHGGVRKSPREVEQVARRGPGERVDGLVRIADDGQVVSVAQPCRQHPLLQWRDVLVLVDDEAAVAVPELLGDRGVVLDRGRGVQQQIVEVEQGNSIAAGLQRLVRRVHRSDLGGIERNVAGRGRHRVGILLGRDQRGFGPLDLAGHVADVVGAQLQAGAGGPARDDREFGVQQLPTRVADHPRPEIPQLPVRGGVKRHRLHGADSGFRVSPQSPQPRPHFAGRALGEGHRQYLARGYVSGRDELGDAVGDRAGLTGARPSEHTDRPTGSQHRLALLVIEVGNQRIRDYRHGVHLGSDRRQTAWRGIPATPSMFVRL